MRMHVSVRTQVRWFDTSTSTSMTESHRQVYVDTYVAYGYMEVPTSARSDICMHIRVLRLSQPLERWNLMPSPAYPSLQPAADQ